MCSRSQHLDPADAEFAAHLPLTTRFARIHRDDAGSGVLAIQCALRSLETSTRSRSKRSPPPGAAARAECTVGEVGNCWLEVGDISEIADTPQSKLRIEGFLVVLNAQRGERVSRRQKMSLIPVFSTSSPVSAVRAIGTSCEDCVRFAQSQ